jgi:hypothetical protein
MTDHGRQPRQDPAPFRVRLLFRGVREDRQRQRGARWKRWLTAGYQVRRVWFRPASREAAIGDTAVI